MIFIEEYVDIRNYCTLKVGGQFRYLVRVKTIDELQEAYVFAQKKNIPVFVLGGGSNMVFPDGILEKVVIKMELLGTQVCVDTNDYTDIRAAAGENWDAFVGMTVSMNLSGIEAMSAIPGTVGATPVQNVGAYGQEAKDTILSVGVFDSTDGKILTLSNAECVFSYRDSIFKNEAKGKYVIISVTYRLSKKCPTLPNYPGVKTYFDTKQIVTPTLLQIREAIIEIRSTKLPNPKYISNVGSFFKNPIVDKSIAEKLKNEYPQMTVFPVDETHTKVPAGWLIEQTGLKGKKFGTVSVYQNNALVLVNEGGATRKDITLVKDEIIDAVSTKFGIRLETEPEFV